jgi:hypothetical protein
MSVSVGADGIGSTVAVQGDPEVHVVLQKADVVHLGTWIKL